MVHDVLGLEPLNFCNVLESRQTSEEKEKFTSIGISEYKEFIHFGLTSQDINNTAIPLSLKLANKNVYIPKLELLIKNLSGIPPLYI